MRQAVTKGERRVVADIITRVMRTKGFAGQVRVTRVARRRDGSYSATVAANFGHGAARYRATVPAPGAGTSVRVVRQGDVELLA